jgi:hypothetical protein
MICVHRIGACNACTIRQIVPVNAAARGGRCSAPAQSAAATGATVSAAAMSTTTTAATTTMAAGTCSCGASTPGTTAARRGANGCRQNHRYRENHNFAEHSGHSGDTPESLSTRAGVARQSANGGALLPR